MILRFHAAVRAALTDTLLRAYALEPAAMPSIVLESPPNRAMGDLACPVAFELARRLRKAPQGDRRRDRRRARPDPGDHQGRGDAERLRQRLPRSPGRDPPPARCRRRGRDAGRRAAAPAREGDRRAHRHQSEQGRPHRSPAQHDARGHPGAAAALRRRAGGGAELHRRHRRPGRRRRRRLRAPRAQDARRGAGDRRYDALRLLLLGPLREGHRVVRRRQGAAEGAQRDPARHRARRQRHRRARRLHRRPHRAGPPGDDGPSQRRLRPPDVGGRHPAPEVLGHRLRSAPRERHDVQADRGQAGRLLGDADRRGRRRSGDGVDAAPKPLAAEAGPEARTARTSPNSARRSSCAPTAPSPTSARTSPTSTGSSGCSGRTSTTGRSGRASPATRCGRPRPRRAAIARTGRRSAAPMPSTT